MIVAIKILSTTGKYFLLVGDFYEIKSQFIFFLNLVIIFYLLFSCGRLTSSHLLSLV